MLNILLVTSYWIGNLIRLPLAQNIEISFIDLAVGLIFLRHMSYFTSQWKILSKQRLFQCSVLFLCIALISLIVHVPSWGLVPTLISSLYLLRLALYMSLLFMPIRFSYRQVYILIAGFTLFGLFQYFFYPNLRNLLYLGWDDHYLRLFGSLLDPNFTGVVSVLMIVTLLHYLQKNPRDRQIISLLLALTGVTLLLTYSRSAYLVFFAAIATFGIAHKKSFVMGAVLMIFVIGLIVIPKNLPSEGVDLLRISSIAARQKEYTDAFVIIKDNPLLGVGYNAYRYAQLRYGFEQPRAFPSHAAAGVPNSYLFILATTGVLGFAAFILWLGALIQRYMSKLPIALPLLTAYVVSGLFDNTLVYPFIMLWVILLLKQTEFAEHGSNDERRHEKIRQAK